jgi:hypothetical protein
MKIELKKIEFHNALSEYAHAFNAKVYINGIYAGDAYNRGRDMVHSFDHKDDKGRQLLDEAELYCGKLAGETPEQIEEGRSFHFHLSKHVNDLVNNYRNQKEDAKYMRRINKAMIDSIVYGKTDGDVFMLRFKLPLKELLAHPTGPGILRDKIKNEVLAKLKDGNKVLNDNIPEAILKEAGLSVDQYNKPQNVQENTPAITQKSRNKI